MKPERFEKQMREFIRWMGKDGMLARWEERRKMGEVARKRRELSRKIQAAQVAQAAKETKDKEGKDDGRH